MNVLITQCLVTKNFAMSMAQNQHPIFAINTVKIFSDRFTTIANAMKIVSRSVEDPYTVVPEDLDGVYGLLEKRRGAKKNNFSQARI